MTAAYTHANWNHPSGSSTGPDVPLKARDGLRNLRDALFTGKMKDYTFERQNGAGSADEPQYWVFKNTTTNIWLRATNTWTSAKITSQVVEWSDDGGSTWATVHAADAIVYDGNLNITSQSVGSGFYVFVLELIAKVKKVVSDLATHIAATGAHGVGTLAAQNDNAVDLNGGAIDGCDIGIAVRGKGDFTRVTEDHSAYAPGSNAGVTVDWSKGSSVVTNNGVNVLTFSNIPASGRAGLVLDVTNFNNTTFPAAVDWGLGGKPSITGAATIGLLTRDGGTTIRATVTWRAV
jgi:hypothetical protein